MAGALHLSTLPFRFGEGIDRHSAIKFRRNPSLACANSAKQVLNSLGSEIIYLKNYKSKKSRMERLFHAAFLRLSLPNKLHICSDYCYNY